ncbi:hypothetical protein [Alcanivorax jadensis]|uniref:hypothetical protein n=1 Tax=Alcanivorax jadensis TaxID=64988 RepID=UPI0023523D3C|nr:hypothetical protein [Alcanivorax jadensis]|tara:strand:- start:1999 stop:2976 length:978 start_codon:yes stop_codon:yes gene_type:complete
MKWSILFAAVTLTGCGLTIQQKADSTAIAKATVESGEFSSENLAQLRRDIIDLQVAYYKINPNAECLDTDVGTCTIPLDQGVTTDDLAPRIAISDALAAYGKTIDSLINADHKEEIAEAASDLRDSLASASDKSEEFSLSDDQLDAISALIDVAGRWNLERQRKKALIEISAGYATVIDQVTPLLIQDLSLKWDSPCRPAFRDGRADNAPTSGAHKEDGILDLYCSTAYNLKRNAKILIDDSNSTNLQHAIRVDAVDAYVMAHNAQVNGFIISNTGTKLLSKLKDSADELGRVAKDKNYKSKDIKELGKDLKSLSSSLKVLITKE